MSEDSIAPPVVFISYSHDSEEHKKWVRDFATALRDVGIDVILDQWEIGPGDDVPKFMEQSVRRALRVIMICTEEYVRKVDDGTGGAGYEAMVVTGELVRDLGTRKFIPVVRQSGETPSLPACISTRYYVNFSIAGCFAEKLEELARNIQNAPRFEKPPLGKNPFTASAATDGAVPMTPGPNSAPSEPCEIYELALSYANAGNFAKWRELIHREKANAGEALLRWKAENQQYFPSFKKDLPAYFLPSVATHDGLFAAAFGAFDSTDERFHNQLSLLDWIRKPKGWERSGNTVWVELPNLILFVYQALLGGLAMSRHRPELAYNLATTPISDNYSGSDAHPLFKNSKLTGWPESFGNDCTLAWSFLQSVTEDWKWLWKLFGSEEDTLAAIVSYYFFLNTVDFVSSVKAKKADQVELRGLNPPLFICRADDVKTRSQTLFFAVSDYLGEILVENGISRESLPDLWAHWIQNCENWLGAVYRENRYQSYMAVAHRELPTMLFGNRKNRLIE